MEEDLLPPPWQTSFRSPYFRFTFPTLLCSRTFPLSSFYPNKQAQNSITFPCKSSTFRCGGALLSGGLRYLASIASQTTQSSSSLDQPFTAPVLTLSLSDLFEFGSCSVGVVRSEPLRGFRLKWLTGARVQWLPSRVIGDFLWWVIVLCFANSSSKSYEQQFCKLPWFQNRSLALSTVLVLFCVIGSGDAVVDLSLVKSSRPPVSLLFAGLPLADIIMADGGSPFGWILLSGRSTLSVLVFVPASWFLYLVVFVPWVGVAIDGAVMVVISLTCSLFYLLFLILLEVFCWTLSLFTFWFVVDPLGVG